MGRAKTSTIAATEELYPDLQEAMNFFNRRLFAETLPPCMITLQREKATLGFFSPRRYVRFDGQITHEIAMGPQYFASRTVKQTLSTLVHECVHLQQEAYGSPSRAGYHNREWGSFMRAVGLMPSDTGQPGGKQVGDRMSHYIIEGGPFDRAADELLARGFQLRWVDRYPAEIPLGALEPGEPVPPSRINGDGEEVDAPPVTVLTYPVDDGITVEVVSRLPPAAFVDPGPRPLRLPEPGLAGAASAIEWPSDRSRPKATRVKYQCPQCSAQVWGKPKMELKHMPCDRYMLAQDDGYHPRQRLGGSG